MKWVLILSGGVYADSAKQSQWGPPKRLLMQRWIGPQKQQPLNHAHLQQATNVAFLLMHRLIFRKSAFGQLFLPQRRYASVSGCRSNSISKYELTSNIIISFKTHSVTASTWISSLETLIQQPFLPSHPLYYLHKLFAFPTYIWASPHLQSFRTSLSPDRCPPHHSLVSVNWLSPFYG